MRLVCTLGLFLALLHVSTSLLLGAFNIKSFGDKKSSNTTLMNIISTVWNTTVLHFTSSILSFCIYISSPLYTFSYLKEQYILNGAEAFKYHKVLHCFRSLTCTMTQHFIWPAFHCNIRNITMPLNWVRIQSYLEGFGNYRATPKMQ